MSTIETFDFSVDILRALLWRNNSAVNIQALLAFKQANYDADSRDFWENWIRDVFDLRTANEFGLNVWSIILGLNITIAPTVAPTPSVPGSNWGYGADRQNYFDANYGPSAGDVSLPIEDARVMLRLRYYQLTTNGNVSSINLILQDVFGHLGSSFVTDNLDMTMHYTFLFQLSSSIQIALSNFDLLPRPSGVLVTFAVDFANANFGFGEFRKNFGNGNFSPSP